MTKKKTPARVLSKEEAAEILFATEAKRAEAKAKADAAKAKLPPQAAPTDSSGGVISDPHPAIEPGPEDSPLDTDAAIPPGIL